MRYKNVTIARIKLEIVTRSVSQWVTSILTSSFNNNLVENGDEAVGPNWRFFCSVVIVYNTATSVNQNLVETAGDYLEKLVFCVYCRAV